MLGNLSSEVVEQLLTQQIVGRIGCHDGDFIYVLPISYAYDGKNIYCHSYEGKKIDIMRKHPRVCFQVDEFQDMANWKSVIAWGKYEEITDRSARNKALRLLLQRQLPIASSVTTHIGEAWPFSATDESDLNNIPGIIFRIVLGEKTGKFETASESTVVFN